MDTRVVHSMTTRYFTGPFSRLKVRLLLFVFLIEVSERVRQVNEFILCKVVQTFCLVYFVTLMGLKG